MLRGSWARPGTASAETGFCSLPAPGLPHVHPAGSPPSAPPGTPGRETWARPTAGGSTCPTLLAPRVVVGGGRRCLQSCWHGERTGPAVGATRQQKMAGEACGWHSCIDSAPQLAPFSSCTEVSPLPKDKAGKMKFRQQLLTPFGPHFNGNTRARMGYLHACSARGTAVPRDPRATSSTPSGARAQSGPHSPQYDSLCAWLSNQKPLQILCYQSSDLPLRGDKGGS